MMTATGVSPSASPSLARKVMSVVVMSLGVFVAAAMLVQVLVWMFSGGAYDGGTMIIPLLIGLGMAWGGTRIWTRWRGALGAICVALGTLLALSTITHFFTQIVETPAWQAGHFSAPIGQFFLGMLLTAGVLLAAGTTLLVLHDRRDGRVH